MTDEEETCVLSALRDWKPPALPEDLRLLVEVVDSAYQRVGSNQTSISPAAGEETDKKRTATMTPEEAAQVYAFWTERYANRSLPCVRCGAPMTLPAAPNGLVHAQRCLACGHRLTLETWDRSQEQQQGGNL